MRLNETRPAALLTEPFGATYLAAADARAHTEHATAVLIGVDGDVAVGDHAARVVIVPPDAPYRAHSAGPVVTFAFDPELCPRVASFAREGTARPLPAALSARIAGAVSAHRASLARADVLAGIGTELTDQLGLGRQRPIDRRVTHVVEALRDPNVDREHELARTRISRQHLRELFARDVGTSMRTYLVWRRLLHALAHVGPLDLTASAHAAGFADLAHFSRTCRRMLGYAPSELQRRLAG